MRDKSILSPAPGEMVLINTHADIFTWVTSEVVSIQGYGKGDDKWQQRMQTTNLRQHQTQETQLNEIIMANILFKQQASLCLFVFKSPRFSKKAFPARLCLSTHPFGKHRSLPLLEAKQQYIHSVFWFFFFFVLSEDAFVKGFRR